MGKLNSISRRKVLKQQTPSDIWLTAIFFIEGSLMHSFMRPSVPAWQLFHDNALLCSACCLQTDGETEHVNPNLEEEVLCTYIQQIMRESELPLSPSEVQ